MAKILRFLQFLAVATAASCLTTVDKRATGGYVQNPSGSASFTHYSGCGQPGAHVSCVPPLTPRTSSFPNLRLVNSGP